MIKLLGISVSALFCSLLLKDKNRPAAVMISVAGACLLFFAAAGELKEMIDRVERMTSVVSSSASYIRLMLKVLGITLLTQFVSDICRDNGENALASMTEAAAKIIVIALVLPLFETVITIAQGLVK